MLRQGRRRCLLVPLALLDQLVQVVADRLLVERRLSAARLVALAGPEARAVRRQHFVDDDELTVREHTELELRIGDDDASLFGDLAAAFVDREAALTQFVREFVTYAALHVVERDVLVMLADFRLRRGREDRRIEPRTLRQTLGQLLAGQRSLRAVLLPRGAGD